RHQYTPAAQRTARPNALLEIGKPFQIALPATLKHLGVVEIAIIQRINVEEAFGDDCVQHRVSRGRRLNSCLRDYVIVADCSLSTTSLIRPFLMAHLWRKGVCAIIACAYR